MIAHFTESDQFHAGSWPTYILYIYTENENGYYDWKFWALNPDHKTFTIYETFYTSIYEK
jgi:hypothetical protein